MTEEVLNPQAHWNDVYGQRNPRQLSWHEPAPEISLALITRAGVPRDAGIIDVGGGTSVLAGALLAKRHTDITVADISAASLQAAQATLGADAQRIRWIQADVRSHNFGRRYQLWHDRAVFHFMVTTADRQAYLDNLRRTLAPDGCVILATFGLAGPTHCSGYPPAATTPPNSSNCSARTSTRSPRAYTSTQPQPAASSNSSTCSRAALHSTDQPSQTNGQRHQSPSHRS